MALGVHVVGDATGKFRLPLVGFLLLGATGSLAAWVSDQNADGAGVAGALPGARYKASAGTYARLVEAGTEHLRALPPGTVQAQEGWSAVANTLLAAREATEAPAPQPIQQGYADPVSGYFIPQQEQPEDAIQPPIATSQSDSAGAQRLPLSASASPAADLWCDEDDEDNQASGATTSSNVRSVLFKYGSGGR